MTDHTLYTKKRKGNGFEIGQVRAAITEERAALIGYPKKNSIHFF